jgi:competence protein ComFC
MNRDVEIAGKYLIKNVITLGYNLINQLFPNTCVLCGQKIDFRQILCQDCREKVFGVFPVMSVNKKFRFLDKLWTFTKYDEIRDVIINYKFTPRIRLSKILAEALYKVYRSSPELKNIPHITFVPSTKVSKLQRGFDHIEKLTHEFSKVSNTELLKFLKAINKKPQIELDGKKRISNVIGKYRIAEIKTIPEKIILIDDIVTTGSTIDECAKVLKSIGIKEVHGLTLAYNF